MPRVSEGQILNPAAMTLEHILARIACFNLRLDELGCRVATTNQPPRPDPAIATHQPSAANVTPQPGAIPPPDSPDIIREEEVAGLKTRQVLVGE